MNRLLREMIGLDRSSPWFKLRTVLVWLRDAGKLASVGFRVTIRRWEGPRWSVIHISQESDESGQELRYLLFSEPSTQTELGRAFPWQLRPRVREFANQGCLVVCDMNRLLRPQFRGVDCVRVFPWLRAFLNVSDSLDQIVGRMRRRRKRDLSKIEEKRLEYGISRDLSDFEHFYRRMHLPYITDRYGERAIVQSYGILKRMFKRRGQLVYVGNRTRPVAAYLAVRRVFGRTLSALLLGVDGERAGSARQCDTGHVYWHVIRWAHDAGVRRIDFGRTRARLTDGVFEFKRGWGMRYEPDVMTHTRWTFAGKNLPAALFHHLNELGLIAEIGRELRCVVFAVKGDGFDAKELARRERVSLQAGLGGLAILPGTGRLGDDALASRPVLE